MLGVLVILPYQLMMAYGMLTLAGFWASPSQAHARDIPEPMFLAFGLAIPLASWIFTTFSAFSLGAVPFAFALPLSLGFLYLRSRSSRAEGARGQDALWEEELKAAEEALARDPGNASAHWSKAQAYEKRGDWELALECYEKTHALSARTLPAPELADIRARLEHAISLKRERPNSGPGTALRLENLFAGLGLLYLFWNWTYAMNLCSLMLFIRWLRGDAS